MNTKNLKSQQRQVDPLKGEEAMTTWLESLAAFHILYSQLADALHQNKINTQVITKLDPKTSRPIAPMRVLVVRMQREMEALLQDTDLFEPLAPTNYKAICKKLIAHTNRLRRFNQQALVLLAGQSVN
ncbi:hypothetical protein [Spirosoma gilvum]